MILAVIIPAFKVSRHIETVVKTIPDFIDHIIVVDDHCPESSGKKAEMLQDRRVIVLYNESNSGVGGATISGYKKAIDLGADIIIKMDGDGQMNSAYIRDLLKPIEMDYCDYAKGNRFRDFRSLLLMPKIRLIGNAFLSFAIKLASGYWDIMDPTNGFTAIRRDTLESLPLQKISKRYFFESDMLINLNIMNAVVKDVPMPAYYGSEKSSLKIPKLLIPFLFHIQKGLAKRVFLKYFIHDFNMISIYLILGVPMLFFGIISGLVEWIESALTGVPRSAGTIMLVALPIIVAFQMLLQAINLDINSIPKKNFRK